MNHCQVDPRQALRPPEEQCRQLAARIVASREFVRATKQRDFLLYVVDRKLCGFPEDVTETLIGHRVYGRPASYDAGNDSIVRTEARTLRKRLERYFEGEGIEEPIVIDIPCGGYLSVFLPRVEPFQAPVPSPAVAETWPSRRKWMWLGSAVTGAAVLLGGRNRSFFLLRDNPTTFTPGAVQLESSDSALNAGLSAPSNVR